MLPVALEFSDTVNLGSILIVLLAGAGALAFTIRGHAGRYWREAFEAEKQRLEQVRAERDEQRALKHTALSEIAALKMTRDFTPLITQQQQVMARVVAMQEEGESRYGLALSEMRDMFATHEQRAQDRHEALLEVTKEIAGAIGHNGELLDKISARLDNPRGGS